MIVAAVVIISIRVVPDKQGKQKDAHKLPGNPHEDAGALVPSGDAVHFVRKGAHAFGGRRRGCCTTTTAASVVAVWMIGSILLVALVVVLVVVVVIVIPANVRKGFRVGQCACSIFSSGVAQSWRSRQRRRRYASASLLLWLLLYWWWWR